LRRAEGADFCITLTPPGTSQRTDKSLLLPIAASFAFDGERVTFKWKDYGAKGDARYKLMTLDADEFIRRFLIHVLLDGFHRIRHYGLFANANRASNIALARRLLAVPDPTPPGRASDHAENGRDDEDWNACPCCGGRMIIVEAFEPTMTAPLALQLPQWLANDATN
jgi:hypothetical protein